MILKTKMSIAKEFAKKHYAGAMDSMKELTGKSIAKAKTLKSKTLSKVSAFKEKKAQYYKDVNMYKGSFPKQLAADIRQEGRALRKNVLTGKNALNTVMTYPITTGLGIGVAVRGLAPRKEKNKKKKKG